jgi:hypothetical protein
MRTCFRPNNNGMMIGTNLDEHPSVFDQSSMEGFLGIEVLDDRFPFPVEVEDTDKSDCQNRFPNSL